MVQGNINALVLVVGFPDRDTTWQQITNFYDPNYPDKIYPNEFFPKLGTYPNGTTLREKIAINGYV